MEERLKTLFYNAMVLLIDEIDKADLVSMEPKSKTRHQILLKMVRVFTKTLEHEIVIDPYGFMLRLDEPRAENYDGSASLVLGTCAIMRTTEDLESYSKSFRHYINVFLDHFIF